MDCVRIRIASLLPIQEAHDRRYRHTVQKHRNVDYQPRDAPQPLGLRNPHVVHAVGEVVDCPHTPDAEEGKSKLLAAIGGKAEQPDPAGDRPHDQQDCRRHRDIDPCDRVEQTAYQRAAEEDQEDHHCEPFDLLGQRMHLALEVVFAMRVAEGQRSHEHG